MGLVLVGLAGLLVGGIISLRRQGAPVAVQVVLGVGVVGLLVLALQTDTFQAVTGGAGS
jgi:hypothetical protein